MAGNHNVHNVNDDEYYHCPNNECPCHGSSDNNNDDHYKRAFPDTIADNDDYEHYDKLFGSYDNGDFNIVNKYPTKHYYDS
jgi:hypothetical protein